MFDNLCGLGVSFALGFLLAVISFCTENRADIIVLMSALRALKGTELGGVAEEVKGAFSAVGRAFSQQGSVQPS